MSDKNNGVCWCWYTFTINIEAALIDALHIEVKHTQND